MLFGLIASGGAALCLGGGALAAEAGSAAPAPQGGSAQVQPAADKSAEAAQSVKDRLAAGRDKTEPPAAQTAEQLTVSTSTSETVKASGTTTDGTGASGSGTDGVKPVSVTKTTDARTAGGMQMGSTPTDQATPGRPAGGESGAAAADGSGAAVEAGAARSAQLEQTNQDASLAIVVTTNSDTGMRRAVRMPIQPVITSRPAMANDLAAALPSAAQTVPPAKAPAKSNGLLGSLTAELAGVVVPVLFVWLGILPKLAAAAWSPGLVLSGLLLLIGVNGYGLWLRRSGYVTAARSDLAAAWNFATPSRWDYAWANIPQRRPIFNGVRKEKASLR